MQREGGGTFQLEAHDQRLDGRRAPACGQICLAPLVAMQQARPVVTRARGRGAGALALGCSFAFFSVSSCSSMPLALLGVNALTDASNGRGLHDDCRKIGVDAQLLDERYKVEQITRDAARKALPSAGVRVDDERPTAVIGPLGTGA